MRFDEKDFKNKLKNNHHIPHDFASIQNRIEKEIIYASKKESFFKRIKNFFKKPSFLIPFYSLVTSSLIITIVLSVIIPILFNNQPPVVPPLPIETTPPVFTGLRLKEEGIQIEGENNLLSYEKNNLEEDKTFKKVEDLIDTTSYLPKDNNYYIDVKSDIILDVNFYNPDKFEIISFEIYSSLSDEAVKFTNYMFLPGSNLEHIYINAGQMPNEEVTFKIDNIKYIDKTKIKICKKEGKDYVTCLPRNFAFNFF